MSKALASLERVLNLESQQGYQDKAVVGGIRQFAVYWISQAEKEAADEADKALFEQIAESLMEYGRQPGPEAREKTITSLREKLKVHQVRQKKKKAVESPSVTQPVETPVSPPAPVVKPVKRSQPEPEQVTPDLDGLHQPVTAIRGVGPKMAKRLEALGASTVWDLLYIFPRRYDDYTLLKPINRLNYGDQVTIIGTIWETRVRRTRNVQLVQSIITDGTGQVQATWFNQPWLSDKLKAGSRIVISGTVDQFLGKPVFQNPDWEPLELEPLRTRRIVPVYPLTKGLTANKLREIMKRAVKQWARFVPETLSSTIRDHRKFLPLADALQHIHFPESQEFLHRARQRLAFDELFLLQLGMISQRRDWQSAPGLPVPDDLSLLTPLLENLPFKLTNAQQRVIKEIAADMAKRVPMNRLLQGDVGSGKTVVAASAMVLAVRAGMQAAMMAPTEILAEQHFHGLSRFLSPLGIHVTLLTGSTPASEKEQVYSDLASGSAQIVVGTHALIQEKVQFKKLGLAIIDEQHRFGVDQRRALREKGSLAAQNGSDRPNPHLLVMSATPIPRTLALSLYGDLDLSTLDELPPGRQEIKTVWLKPSERERAYSFVRGQIERGRQAFVICPLVEESESIEAKSAVEEYERLQRQIFPDLKLGLLHGRMNAAEKEATMRAFHGGEIDILVATSVIEVGIDVPNSTVMVIEGANRFGLAQLHQFRGRVGRGEFESYCLLLADSVSGDAEERLQALEQTNDGFLLAEKDLEIRGPGEFLGRRQSGLPELHLASLTDMRMLEAAREEALTLIEADPYLQLPEHKQLQPQLAKFWESTSDVS